MNHVGNWGEGCVATCEKNVETFRKWMITYVWHPYLRARRTHAWRHMCVYMRARKLEITTCE